MSELPNGWILTNLENVCSVITDGTHRTPKYVEKGIPFISIANIKPFKPIDWETYKRFITEEEHKELTLRCKPEYGDILITRIGTLGLAKRVDFHGEFSIFVGLGLLKPIRDFIDSRYLEAWMNSPIIKELSIEKATGSGRQTLALQEINKLPIPLAPLNEQKRIADKLDSLLARVDACRAHLDRVLEILKRFRQTVLATAVSGKLTKAWEGDHNNWEPCTLGSVLTDLKYGTSKKSVYDLKNGIPVLRIPNIGDGKIDPTDLKYGRFDVKELENLSLRHGDLLLIRSNGSVDLVGKVAVVSPEFEGYAYAGYLIRLRFDRAKINPYYVSLYLSSPDIRKHIELTARSTSGVNNINSDEVKAIPFELPSLPEQNEIVRRVESLFTFVDHLEAHNQTARSLVDNLTPMILAKAFRGELVPQNSHDEPASVLLERIRAERAAAEKEEKTKRVTGAKPRRTRIEELMLKLSEISATHLTDILNKRGSMTAETLWAASQLEIEDFYDQLKDEELRGLLQEIRNPLNDLVSVLQQVRK